MKFFHYTVSLRGRSSGSSAVAAAAYRSRSVIYDERRGLAYDFSESQDIVGSIVLAPDNAPSWVYDRSTLWNRVEKSENRVNSQLFRNIEFALPSVFDKERMLHVVRKHVQQEFVDRGMIADVNIHCPAGENPHAHVMLTLRDISADGFGKKNREWNKLDNVSKWRESYAEALNGEFEDMGFGDMRVSPCSYKKQQIDKKPGHHNGYSSSKPSVNDEEEQIVILAERYRLKKELEDIQDEIDMSFAARRLNQKRKLARYIQAWLGLDPLEVTADGALLQVSGEMKLDGLSARLQRLEGNVLSMPASAGVNVSPR